MNIFLGTAVGLAGCCLMVGGTAHSGPTEHEHSESSLTEHDMKLLQQSLERLREMTDRPKLSFEDNTVGHIDLGKRWPYTVDPKTPALLVEPLNRPFLAVSSADRIAADFLGDGLPSHKLLAAATIRKLEPAKIHETQPSPEDVKVLKSLPPLLQAALTDFIRSAASADASCKAAFKGLQTEEMKNTARAYVRFILGAGAAAKEKKLMDRLGVQDLNIPNGADRAKIKAPVTDPQELARAARTFSEACEQLSESVRKISPEVIDTAVAPDKRIELATSLGTIVLGGRGATLHPEPTTHILLAVDFGGNDSYKGAYGAGNGLTGNFLGAVIDLAGDDLYLSNQSFSLGAGLFGVGMLFDLAGDDRYESGHFSIGCGLGGWGMLVDGAGNDWYRGRTNVQGAGIYGMGLLFDAAGSDRYIAEMSAQGYGFTGGLGILADRKGNDHYQAGGRYTDGGAEYPEIDFRYVGFSQGFGYGWRPDSSGGIGCLLDGGGDDVYDSLGAGFVQGCSYWFSYGLLYDAAGDDVYDANYYSQGAGIHFSTGLLIDQQGNDHYKLAGGGGQAWGHDYGVGILIDRKGNDHYAISHWLMDGGFGIGAGQGGGNMKGIALLVDGEGDDEYRTGREWTYEDAVAMYQISTVRQANPKITDAEIKAIVDKRRGIGILLDESGRDTYTSDDRPMGGDGASWKRMYACVVEDLK